MRNPTRVRLRRLRTLEPTDAEVLRRVWLASDPGEGEVRVAQELHAAAPRREDPHLEDRAGGRAQDSIASRMRAWSARRRSWRRPPYFGAAAPASVFDRSWLVLSLAQLGRFAEVAEHEAEAIQLAEPTHHAFTIGLAHTAAGTLHPLHLGLAKLYRRTGKREHAQEHLTTATTMYRQMDMRFYLEQAEAELRESAH